MKHGINSETIIISTERLHRRKLGRRQRVRTEKTKRRRTNVDIDSLFLAGEKGHNELLTKRPHLDLGVTRYPRFVKAIETELNKVGKIRDFSTLI